MPMTLESTDIDSDPFAQFQKWLAEAKSSSGMSYPNAVCLSTITADGFPDARIVLLRGFDAAGFVFFTNFQSAKGEALDRLPRAAMTFYWDKLQRQVRARGTVTPVSADQADEYFKNRPRESQIGAWASDQSRPLTSRAELESRMKTYEAKFNGVEVPRPPHWSGFRLNPERIEFWQEQPFRLHDRFEFRRSGSSWKVQRLFP